MKRISTLAVFFCVCCSLGRVAAADAWAPNATGAYVYVGGGVQMFHQHASVQYDVPHFPEPYSADVKLNQTPIYGHFGLGYGFSVDETFYLAAEVAYDYLGHHVGTQFSRSSSMNVPGAGFTQRLRYNMQANNQIEANVLFGGNTIYNTLTYVKLGYVGTWTKNMVDYVVDDNSSAFFR